MIFVSLRRFVSTAVELRPRCHAALRNVINNLVMHFLLKQSIYAICLNDIHCGHRRIVTMRWNGNHDIANCASLTNEIRIAFWKLQMHSYSAFRHRDPIPGHSGKYNCIANVAHMARGVRLAFRKLRRHAYITTRHEIDKTQHFEICVTLKLHTWYWKCRLKTKLGRLHVTLQNDKEAVAMNCQELHAGSYKKWACLAFVVFGNDYLESAWNNHRRLWIAPSETQWTRLNYANGYVIYICFIAHKIRTCMF